ncbi:uncharacterized protein TRAVEDRAFT_46029 [Trametes versicolor FP-101664 SS1]|uniref:uncharacterized protein n=1 Tax=Trametes versicolor (strain FP-101664) TaxID=717944 RepID=UPI00046212B8|nr:uncharacterized protein TRAVEDRAFT_46029 [Trametes versicolor FP-101664 SS1]EIW60788.1 hypothetical protein TRAVEDRAFT_46029 [Trametes versicolor FP-101664 SS1]
MYNWARSYVLEAVVALQDSTLSYEQVADRIVSLCRTSVREAPESARQDESTDTPGVEMFLSQVWSTLLRLAEEDPSFHDRLAYILSEVRTRGQEDWNIWRTSFDWANLPTFGLEARESMNGPEAFDEDRRYVSTNDPECIAALSGDPPVDSVASRAGARARRNWLNLNAFLARLWVLDVWDCAFYGISTMSMSLEPHSMPDLGYIGPSVELALEVAEVWIRVAGKRMFECREILGPKGNPEWPFGNCPGGSGGTWDGVDGYHPERWQHWKGIFRDISQGHWRSNVIDAAKAAVEAMEQIEREAVATQ